VQVQRATIVNVDFIKEFRKYYRGKFILVLDDLNNTRLETGRSFTESIKEMMMVE
jgi:two-component system LytT family response regulator